MKRVILGCWVLMVSSLHLFGQARILFDASKAESAGNADWVIDADQHNLSFNPFASPGGSESNAQRQPTPAQSGITAGTPEDFWKGAISAWGVDAVKQGYLVETLPYDGQITYGNAANLQDLSLYDVFILVEPNLLFTAAEKTAILTFVQNGGGLFMVADHDNSDRNGDGDDSPHIWNDLMQNNTVQANPFGITFDYQFFDQTSTNVAVLPGDSLLHGPMGNVTEVQFFGGTSMTLNPAQNATVKGVVYKTGASTTGNTQALCAYSYYGNGKVAALSDSSPADDGTGDTGDNLYDGWITDANGNHERLIMNATIWLAAEYVVGVEPVLPRSVMAVSARPHRLFLSGNEGTAYDLRIVNLQGQTMYARHFESRAEVDLSAFAAGIYLYEIESAAGFVDAGKFGVLD